VCVWSVWGLRVDGVCLEGVVEATTFTTFKLQIILIYITDIAFTFYTLRLLISLLLLLLRPHNQLRFPRLCTR